MKAAYVDTSCLVAIAFGEKGFQQLVRAFGSYDHLISSNLLEAELRSAFRREKVSFDPEELMAGISWVLPDRPLTPELAVVLDAGYVRGADLWHLATALFAVPSREIDFLTLDAKQRAVSQKLHFGDG